MVDEYVATHAKISEGMASGFKFHDAMNQFIDTELRAEASVARGYPNWMMLLLFKGPNAREALMGSIGQHLPNTAAMGQSIRGAFGDYDIEASGKVREFQPAVVSAYTYESNLAYLKLFAKYADSDGGETSNWWEENDGDTDGDGIVEEHGMGMIMIKPDNFRHASSLPGHIVDLISTTGLHCRGCRVVKMSVAQAQEFYGFLEPIFEKKLAGQVEKRLRAVLSKEFMSFDVNDKQFEQLTDVLKGSYATSEVNSIVQYMCGVHPTSPEAVDRTKPGPAQCLALLYSGENAIDRIRTKLGATNPGEALEGSVRADYGRDVMHNACHASDAPDSLVRECKIIGLGNVSGASAPEVEVINDYLRSVGEL